jgi:hypothetical protein
MTKRPCPPDTLFAATIRKQNSTREKSWRNLPGANQGRRQRDGFLFEIPMGRRHALILLMLIAAAATAARTISPSFAQTAPLPSDRCQQLNRQIDEAASSGTRNRPLQAARNLQRRGSRLCSVGRKTQGIRSLGRALRLLGAKSRN